MSSRWFRFYDGALDDPKVQKLSGDDFKTWVNLLCLASRNDGKLPCIDDVSFSLRIDLDATQAVFKRFLNAALVDRVSGGQDGYHYAPHGWSKRQYKSDTSNARVKRYRERKRNVTETGPDTDTDTELPLPKGNGAKPDSDKEFWANAKSYLGGPKSGALIGKWCKDYGQGETAKAITAAQTERAVDPIPYITAVLRKQNSNSDVVVGI